MTGSKDFLSAEEHFDRLLDRLSPRDLKQYEACQHVRVETAYRNRHFVVYVMAGREPKEIDRIVVNDFNADDTFGASTEVTSLVTKKRIAVGYTPVRVFEHPVFIWIPLNTRIRWSAYEGALDKGSLGFPLCLRTQSRLHLREKAVTYMETGPQFGKEFDTKAR